MTLKIPTNHSLPMIGQVVHDAIIVCHNEDTSSLESALQQENFNVQKQKGPYTPEQKKFPAQIRCLINHANAWKSAASKEGYTLIVEADFVPVIGMSKHQLPFLPNSTQLQMAWLYSMGPVIYHLEKPSNTIYGHNGAMVAYVIDKQVAKKLLVFFHCDMEKHQQTYRAFDTYLSISLRREHGVKCYIPYKNLGEHGGIANPEHKKNNICSWHEADCLAGKLHFLPQYAQGSLYLYFMRRARGRLRGFMKFFCGKYFDGWLHGWWKSKSPYRWTRAKIALFRLI